MVCQCAGSCGILSQNKPPLANAYMSQPSWWLSLAMWSCSYHWVRAEVIGTTASPGPLRLAMCFPGYFLLLTDWRQVRMTQSLWIQRDWKATPWRWKSHTTVWTTYFWAAMTERIKSQSYLSHWISGSLCYSSLSSPYLAHALTLFKTCAWMPSSQRDVPWPSFLK